MNIKSGKAIIHIHIYLGWAVEKQALNMPVIILQSLKVYINILPLFFSVD